MDFVFKLNEAQANVVLQALADGPYKTVAAVIVEMQKQAQEQMAPKPEPAQEH